MSWAAVAVGAAGVIGGVMASNAAGSAANAQLSAAKDSNATQLSMYNTTRSDLAPYRTAGYNALAEMTNDPKYQQNFTAADFQADPGYQFRMDEGQKALERSAAAKGSLMSGGTLKALDRYSQGLGSQEYQNAYDRFNNDRTTTFNRLASIAGVGQTANAQLGSAGQNAANNISATQQSAGNAAAAGIVGQSNATNNMIGQGTNTWMNYQLMNRAFPTTNTSTPSGGNSYTPSAGGYFGSHDLGY